MDLITITLVICGYLFVFLCGLVIGFFFGPTASKNVIPPYWRHDPKDTLLRFPDPVTEALTTNGTTPMIKPKPTQSAVMKFPKPEMARARREKQILDDAMENSKTIKRESGSFAL